MTPIDEVLAKIRERAVVLNQKSDSLNFSIENLEGQLEGVGVEYWWNAKEIADPVPTDRGMFDFADGDRFFYVLGYCKLGDKWRIATKKRASGFAGTRDEDQPTALAKAPRGVRVEVARYLEGFFHALLQQMDAVDSKLDTALAAAKAPLTPKPGGSTTTGPSSSAVGRRKPGR